MDLKTIETLLAQHSITKIKVGGFDIDGVLRGKYISRDKFDSAAETITLRHAARSREGFARGALKAAQWIIGRKGCYEFSEVLFGGK